MYAWAGSSACVIEVKSTTASLYPQAYHLFIVSDGTGKVESPSAGAGRFPDAWDTVVETAVDEDERSEIKV